MEVVCSKYRYECEIIDSKRKLNQMLDKLLQVVFDYVSEKKINNIDDDFNEYNYNKHKFINIGEKIDKKECIIYTYYIKYESNVIGTVFFIFDRKNKFKNYDAELCCFYINKNHRGIGYNWIKNDVFPHLKERNINNIYVKSSHSKAFSFYERLGTKIGTYKLKSDNNIYERPGNIYMINI